MKQRSTKYKKVLIIRFSSIGDIVVTSPIVRCVKHQWQSEIHYLTFDKNAHLVQFNPYIDKIHTISKDIDNATIGTLKNEKYDLVVDLHKSLRSRLLLRKLRCKSVSFDKKNVQKWMLTQFHYDTLKDEHLVDRYFTALKPYGLDNDGKGLDFFIDPKAKVLLHDGYAKFNVLVLGATYYTKRIPTQLARKIISASELPMVLIGGKDVVKQAKQLSDLSGVINQVGQLSIHESAYILNKSNRVYTGDTGMMHIAAALKKAITIFWGNTTPKFGLYPYYGTHSAAQELIQKEVQLNCRPCSKLGYNQCPKGHFKCMLNQEL